MKLVVFSHKQVWENQKAESGFATDGGFAFHMKAVSEIFSKTVIAVPVLKKEQKAGEVYIEGHNLSVYPLENIKGQGLKRKIRYVAWFIKHVFVFNRLINEADAVHVPIPSDIGTLGMVLARWKRKPLYVRHCGNWLVQKTAAERYWKWYMEKYAGGRNVMLTTGFQPGMPSEKNKNIKWIFSSSLRQSEIEALSHNLPRLDVQAPKLIIVCRMEIEKGPGRVIDALAAVKKTYPDIHLSLVGEGPALQSFKDQAAQLGLSDNITFHGKLNHEGVVHTLQQAHIFCYPTTASEGFPKVVLEAMASGLPVLGTPVSAIRALLKDGAGMLLENEKPETLSAALLSLLGSPEKYVPMQQAAVATAKHFTLEGWRDEIKSHLKPAWEK